MKTVVIIGAISVVTLFISAMVLMVAAMAFNTTPDPTTLNYTALKIFSMVGAASAIGGFYCVLRLIPYLPHIKQFDEASNKLMREKSIYHRALNQLNGLILQNSIEEEHANDDEKPVVTKS